MDTAHDKKIECHKYYIDCVSLIHGNKRYCIRDIIEQLIGWTP